MLKNSFFFCLVFACLANVFAQTETIKIDSDFPGGNIKVNNVSEDTVYLVPDLRDTKGEWFYWYFRVKKAQNRTIYFQFEQKNVFTTFGPAVSKDKGLSWTWLGENSVKDNTFSFTFSSDDSCVSFSMAMPYTQDNLKRFLEKLPANDYLKQERLCTTRKGRGVEKLIIRHPKKPPTYKILLTARHHACEMMVNYVLEGLVESLLFEKDLEWLRNHVEFWIIPFMDKDGVEDGDQGKTEYLMIITGITVGKASMPQQQHCGSRCLSGLRINSGSPWISIVHGLKAIITKSFTLSAQRIQ